MNNIKSISISEYLALKTSDANNVLIDIRKTEDFLNGFIPESIHVPLNRLSKYLEILAKSGTHFIITSYDDLNPEELSALKSLENIHIHAYIQGGYNEWERQDEDIDIIIDIEPDEFALDYKFDDNLLLLDVRDQETYHLEHIYGSQNFPVKNFNDIIYLADIDMDKNIYIHCGGGSSSVFAASFFKKQDIHNVYIISCGYKCLKDSDKFNIAAQSKKTSSDQGNEMNTESSN